MTRLLLLVAIVLAAAPNAYGMASHYGWPPRSPGTLMMNKDDSDRPLDARPMNDPFGGTDPSYSCDTEHKMSGSCGGSFVRPLYGQDGLVMTDEKRFNRLYGGHGDDTIHGGPWGDVIWGDYHPTENEGPQSDLLWGGDGPDFIYPSHGKNVVKAGGGDDVIHGLYGHGLIDCGPGRDAVYLPRPMKKYTYKHCEWKRHKTGESAPRWLLKRLPWKLRNN